MPVPRSAFAKAFGYLAPLASKSIFAPGSMTQLERRLRRPLFQKYFIVLFIAVVVPLLVNGASEAWFGQRDERTLLDQGLRVEASAAAAKIAVFLQGIRDQMEWVVQLPWSEANSERQRQDALHVLRQVPAIVDLMLLDASGIERLHLSRLGPDVIDSGVDRSGEPGFIRARNSRNWYGPVTLNAGSEPYMAMAVAGNRASVGVALVEINLKLIWDVVAAIHVGATGSAFVIDRDGKLIADPDISLVLQGADAKSMADNKALQAMVLGAGSQSIATRDASGRNVLLAMAPVPGMDWVVFVEQPISEALAPIRATLWRTGLFVLVGAVLAALLAYTLARRMSKPIKLLEQGVERIGAGEFHHRIAISTADELERLAGRVNQMARELAVSQDRSERIARLKRFLSPQVAEIVERSGTEDLLIGHRADVVILFCDLRGFTSFSARAEPEEVMRVLEEYYGALGAIIIHYGATLTHFAGDGMMVLLNAPVPCPDNAAVHGVRMAQEMQAAVQGLILAWSARGHVLGFSVGIAKGVATVGRIGYEGRHDYTAIGPVANLASRLCSTAEDRQILVDANIAAELGDAVILSLLGTRDLKGLGKSITVYAVETRDLAGD